MVQYVFNGTTYDLVQADASARYRGHPFEDLIEAETTGEKTQFVVQYPRAGALAGVPVNGVFRPRWWFEVEMTMGDRGGAVAGQP